MLILTLSLPLFKALSSNPTMSILFTVSWYFFARNPLFFQSSHSTESKMHNCCNPWFTNVIHYPTLVLCKNLPLFKYFTWSDPNCIILSKTFKSINDLEGKYQLGFLIWCKYRVYICKQVWSKRNAKWVENNAKFKKCNVHVDLCKSCADTYDACVDL